MPRWMQRTRKHLVSKASVKGRPRSERDAAYSQASCVCKASVKGGDRAANGRDKWDWCFVKNWDSAQSVSTAGCPVVVDRRGRRRNCQVYDDWRATDAAA